MKRVLILAYYFPPIATSGSLRPLGFCQHLEAHGFMPHVISTAPEDAHPPVTQDPGLASRIPASVRVDRLAHVNRLKQLLEFRAWLRRKAGIGRSKRDVGEAVSALESNGAESGSPHMFTRIKTAILNRLFLFPDHQKPWIKAVYQHVLSLPQEEQPDIVFATGNPWSALVAGAKVAKKLGVPFVADFRDPWTRNPKPAVSKALHKLAQRAEQEIMESAAVVVANTQELKAQFVQDYPQAASKIITVTNAYSDDLHDFFRGVSISGRPDSSAFEISHFGSVYELRRPDKLLSAMVQLVENGDLKEGNLKLRFIGHWGVEDVECNNHASVLESQGFISREPPLSHQDYLVALKQSQCLLILQQDFPLQIPGKLYEYIATGRQILMVGGKGATANLIETNSLGYAAANDIEQLKHLLLGLKAGTVRLSTPPRERVEQFSYSSVTEQLAQVFNRLVEAKAHLEKTD